jgi:Sap, sulfolipid-1-addressing protein
MQLLFLALDAALYPTLLAAVVILLAQPRPLRLLAAYLAGGLIISVGLGLAIIALLDGSGALKNEQAGLSVGADLAVGGLALLLAVVLATRQDERLRARRRRRRPEPQPAAEAAPKGEPWTQRILARGSVPIVFIAAMAINVPGAAYLIALKDIAAAHDSTAAIVALVLGFNLIMFLLAEVPLAGLLLAPERTDVLAKRMNAWISGHSRQIAIGLCAFLGLFLTIRGLANAT